MNSQTRFITSIVLLLALTISLFSCSAGNTTTPTTTSQAPVDGTIAPTEESTDRIPTGLKAADYGGYEFRLLGNSAGFHEHWASRDLYAETQTGETINDAIYLRNSTIEDKYNVKITASYADDPAGTALKNLKAGNDAYDVLSIQLEGTCRLLATNGLLHDLKKMPNIDLSKPWWDQRANSQLSIGGRLFTTMSDLTVVDKDAVFIYLFNKDLVKDLALDDPYQLVRDHKWTVDKLYSISREVVRDLNGDTVIDENDLNANLLETYAFYESLLSAGETLIKKDADDMPYADLSNQRLVQAFEKWITVYNDRVYSWMAQDYQAKYEGNLVWDLALDMLNTKRALFLFTGMNRVTMLRKMECNFGILPMPLLNEKQTEYSNPVHSWCATSISIPTTVSDLDRTTTVLEALTAESFYTLRLAYYDVSLKSKLIRDEESKDMLDLIFSTRTYDLGQVFNFGGLFDLMTSMANKKDTNFVSAIEKNQGKIETAVQKTVDQFKEIP